MGSVIAKNSINAKRRDVQFIDPSSQKSDSTLAEQSRRDVARNVSAASESGGGKRDVASNVSTETDVRRRTANPATLRRRRSRPDRSRTSRTVAHLRRRLCAV